MWFRVDDTFLGHPKAVGLSNDALATWTRAGDWCAWQLTDGAFGRDQLAEFAGDADDPDAVAADLLRRRLWEPGAEDGQVQFHDWTDWNPSRAKVLARRKAGANRLARWRENRTAGNAVSNPVSGGDAVTNDVSGPGNAVTNAVTGPRNDVSNANPDPKGRVGTNTGANPPSQRNARDAVTDDDDGDQRTDTENAVMAFMTGAGHPVNRAQAAALIEMTLAGRKPRDPGAYVLATIRKDPAAAARRVSTSRQPPPAADVLPGARRPGGPSTDVTVRAAEARALLGAALHPAPPEEVNADDLPDW